MRIIKRGFIPKPQEDKHFRSNTFPCMVKLPSGRWLAAFKAAEIKGDCAFQHAVMTWSDDEGETWVTPFEPVKLPAIDGVPGLSRIMYFLPLGGSGVLMVVNWIDNSDPAKPYYNPDEESLKNTQIFFSISGDDGENWSEVRHMAIPGIGDPVPLTGPPLQLADGRLICQFEINKREGDPAPWIHKSAMIFSGDGGNTWTDVAIVTEVKNMYYWDQRPAVLADGKSVINFFWTLDGKKQEYSTIHGRESPDGGKTWGDFWDTGIYGQPGQPVDLGDGRIATISIDRTVKPLITVRTTRDRGRTYDDALVVYDGTHENQDSRHVSLNDAWAEMINFSVGHPGLLHLGNGEMLAFYYAGEHTDLTRIEFAKLRIV